MLFFRRLALHRFVKTHPPSRQVSPADHELVSAYEHILPADGAGQDLASMATCNSP
ncbi:hypothetical protein MAMO4S_04411 [Mesorhizobium amorphae]